MVNGRRRTSVWTKTRAILVAGVFAAVPLLPPLPASLVAAARAETGGPLTDKELWDLLRPRLPDEAPAAGATGEDYFPEEIPEGPQQPETPPADGPAADKAEPERGPDQPTRRPGELTRIAAALALQKEAIAAAEATLKQPLAIPALPSISLDCKQTDFDRILDDNALKLFIDTISEPEWEELRQLRRAWRALLLFERGDLIEGKGLDRSLHERLLAKAEKILDDNRRQTDKALAVLAFTNRAARAMQFLGDDGAEQKILARLGEWLAELVPLMIDQLRKEHAYGVIDGIMKIVGAANALGVASDVLAPDALVAKLAAAMHFDLTLTFDLRSTGANGGVEEWIMESKFPVEFKFVEKNKTLKGALDGSGTGRYVAYIDHEGGESQLHMKASDFPAQARIDEMEVCQGKAKLVLDVFAAETETYIFRDGPPVDLPTARWGWIAVFEDKQRETAYYFDIDIHDRQEKAVDHHIVGTQGVFEAKLHVELLHTPK